MKEFKGIIAETFGSITTIRGYADFKDLRDYSEPKDYQRNTITKHLDDISKFYQEGENLFCPEVILSLELKYDYANGDGNVKPLIDIRNGKEFTSNVDDVQVQKLTSVKIVDVELATIKVKENTKAFGRIDGNHRLSAENADRLLDDKIPFCILLFLSEDIKKQETQIFHNINSKVVPLTNEKMLETIIADTISFDDSYLNNNYETSYSLTRKLLGEINWEHFVRIKDLIYETKNTYFVGLFRVLVEDELFDVPDDDYVKRVGEELPKINEALNDCNGLVKNNVAVLGALTYYRITNPIKYYRFFRWILENDISEVENLHINDIVSIFDKINDNYAKNVFVSMPFSDETTDTFDSIKSVIDETNSDMNVNINLIRVDKHDDGYSAEIYSRIIAGIDKSDLMITDLTLGNKNVHHELGYAQGKGKKVLMIYHERNGTTPNSEIGSNVSMHEQLRFRNQHELKSKLKNKIIDFFDL